MSDLSDRIKLAEAMGWSSTCDPNGNVYWSAPPAKYPESYCFDTDELPDPFTDANDDYAVLEWMRVTYNTYEYLMEHQGDKWVNFITALDGSGDEGHSCCYQIGDYARAALKVIADMEQT